MTKKEIATIPTGEKNAIRVQLVTRDETLVSKALHFIDVRHIFKGDSDEWIFTKKGIHMSLDVAKEVTIALANALKQTT